MQVITPDVFNTVFEKLPKLDLTRLRTIRIASLCKAPALDQISAGYNSNEHPVILLPIRSVQSNSSLTLCFNMVLKVSVQALRTGIMAYFPTQFDDQFIDDDEFFKRTYLGDGLVSHRLLTIDGEHDPSLLPNGRWMASPRLLDAMDRFWELAK